MPEITTFLMFEGRAEEAMHFYVSLFPDAEVLHVSHYDENGPGKPGTVVHATFRLAGRRFMCIDSSTAHAFTFTPSMSLHVACDTPAEVDRLAGKLGEGGRVLMPLDEYPFARRYAWVSDRFGVSWQVMAA